MSAALLAVVSLPVVAGTALILLGTSRPTRERSSAGWVAVGVLGLGTVLAFVASRTSATIGWPFLLDTELTLTATGTGGLLLPVLLAVATLVQLAATATPETREPRFAGLMLLFVAAAAVTVLAGTLPTLLLGWEVMGATSYALIGYRYSDPHRVASGATAFVTTRAADLGLYLAVAAALAGGSRDLDLSALADLEGAWRHVTAAGLLVAALGKAAQLPFSFWLSRAMDGPSPVSALLHSAAMVALGGYLLLVASPLLAATGWADRAAAWVGVATAVALGAVAVVQTDLKQLLAASTAAQLGFVVLAAGVGATSAGAAHLVGHAAVKALLFLAAGAWLEALGSKQLDTLVGAARRWPAVGALATAALLSLAGLPPLTLWATKDAVLAGALEASTALYVAGLAATALSTAYALTALVVLLGPVSEHPPGVGAEGCPSGRVPGVVPLALAPLALGAVGLGVLTLPAVARALPGHPTHPAPWELAMSSAVVLATAVVVALAGRRLAARSGPSLLRPLQGWLRLEHLARVTVVQPTAAAAAFAARVDDRVVTRTVGAAGTATLRAADRVATADGGIAGAVGMVAATAHRLGSAVRRSSATGQLHHYYLQLVGGVLLILVVLSSAIVVTSAR